MEGLEYFRDITRIYFEPFRFYHLFGVVCVIYIALALYKVVQKKKRTMCAFEQFPGPPAHWLTGNVNEVSFRPLGLTPDIPVKASNRPARKRINDFLLMSIKNMGKIKAA